MIIVDSHTYKHFQNVNACGQSVLWKKLYLLAMLALHLMLLPSYYAPNYVGIIGSSLDQSDEEPSTLPHCSECIQYNIQVVMEYRSTVPRD